MEDQTGCKIPVEGIDTIFVTKSYVNFGADDTPALEVVLLILLTPLKATEL